MPSRPLHPQAPHPWAPHLETFTGTALGWLGAHGFDAASAEDLWQQLSAHFLTTSSRPDSSQDPQAYLWISLRRAAGRAHRQAQPGGVRTLGEEILLTRPDRGPSPLDHLSHVEERAAVRAAVAALPPVFRTVVERRFLQGRTLSQVAHELAIPRPTVATRTHRGLALMEPRLRRYRSALAALIGSAWRRTVIASLLAGVVLGPTAQIAVTEPQVLPPIERPQGEPNWIQAAPTAGFPYAEGWVPRPMPEA